MFGRDSGDVTVVCPYDNTHQILAKSLHAHLTRCRQNHPGYKMSKCKFDNTHIVPKPELAHHHSQCPSKYLLDREMQWKAAGNKSLTGDVEGPSIRSHYVEETIENWDEDPSNSSFSLFNNKPERISEEPSTEPYIPPGATYAQPPSYTSTQAQSRQESSEETFRRMPLAPSRAAQMSARVGTPQTGSGSQVYNYSVTNSMESSISAHIGYGRGRGTGARQAPPPCVGIVNPVQRSQPSVARPSPASSVTDTVAPSRPESRGIARFATGPPQTHVPSFQDQAPPLQLQPPRIPQIDPSLSQGALEPQISSQFEDSLPTEQLESQTLEPEDLQVEKQQLWQHHQFQQMQLLQQQQRELDQLQQRFMTRSQGRGRGVPTASYQADLMPTSDSMFGAPTYINSAWSGLPTPAAHSHPGLKPVPDVWSQSHEVNRLRTPTTTSKAQALQSERGPQYIAPLPEIQKDQNPEDAVEGVQLFGDVNTTPYVTAPVSGSSAAVADPDNSGAAESINEGGVMDLVSDWLEQQKLENADDSYTNNRRQQFSQLSSEELTKYKKRSEKKLKQIAVLERKASSGERLSLEEESKMQKKREIVQDLDIIATLM